MTKDKILEAVTRYRRKHGKPPTRLSGDATAYFGEPETWLNIDNALRFGLRGLDGGDSSLFRFLVEHGLREPPPDTTPVTVSEVKKALQAFAREYNGKLPTQVAPQDPVAPYLPLERVTWANLDERLRLGRCGFSGGSSLSQLAVEMGLQAERGACPPVVEIRAAAQKYLNQNGKLPSLRAGPASDYFGHHETWHRVHALLKKEHNRTLRDCIRDLQYQGPERTPTPRAKISLTEETIVHAAKLFKLKRGRLPAYYSGDATPFFQTMGGKLSWRMVNRALVRGQRGLPGGKTLAQLLVDRGLRKRKSGGKR